jgi:hypothetical protein
VAVHVQTARIAAGLSTAGDRLPVPGGTTHGGVRGQTLRARGEPGSAA